MHMYMYGASSVPAEGEAFVAPPGYAACGWTELRRRRRRRRYMSSTAMRGVQLGIVYWLLCAIYLFAALGSVVASGDSGSVAMQQCTWLRLHQHSWLELRWQPVG